MILRARASVECLPAVTLIPSGFSPDAYSSGTGSPHSAPPPSSPRTDLPNARVSIGVACSGTRLALEVRGSTTSYSSLKPSVSPSPTSSVDPPQALGGGRCGGPAALSANRQAAVHPSRTGSSARDTGEVSRHQFTSGRSGARSGRRGRSGRGPDGGRRRPGRAGWGSAPRGASRGPRRGRRARSSGGCRPSEA